jgi:hypothetical protein
MMANWGFSVGNGAALSATAPVAVSPAAADAVLALANWSSGYPDELGAFVWRSDGAYAADFDLNRLKATSLRSDAPTGWFDLPLYMAGTPGLPTNPPAWGTFGGRTALKFYGPIAQDVDVMPGESVQIRGGIYLLAASTATSVVVRVTDLTTGHQWDAGGSSWDDDGVIESQSTDDTWKDFAVTITADATHKERRLYRVTVTPTAATYSSSTYGYISANGGSGSPAIFGSVDTCALIGHNLPSGATVTLSPQPSGTAITLTARQPSCHTTATSAILAQVWRLAITIPSALRPSTPAPRIGTVWIGTARSMTIKGPANNIGVEESSQNQLRVETRGRIEAVPDTSRPTGTLTLAFTAGTDADFEQIRSEFMRLTRYGADPMLLLPDITFDPDALPIHGRVRNRLSWTVLERTTGNESARSFGIPFDESPFAP